MPEIRCMLHGSFRRDYDLIVGIARLFESSGIKVVAPNISPIKGETNGFIHLENDESLDPRIVELLYLDKISKLGVHGFSYYINPKGILGTSASYELAIDQSRMIRSFFMKELTDHPAYIPKDSVWDPSQLVSYINAYGVCPQVNISENEKQIYSLMQKTLISSPDVSVGALIVDFSSNHYIPEKERKILLVRTHKWKDRFSIIGERVKKGEDIRTCLENAVLQHVGIYGIIGDHVATFTEIDSSEYYLPAQKRIFIDNVVQSPTREVNLNAESQSHIWVSPIVALNTLEIEPNARKTIETYLEHKLAA